MRHLMSEPSGGRRRGAPAGILITSFICPPEIVKLLDRLAETKKIKSSNLAFSQFFEWVTDKYESAPKTRPMLLTPPEIEPWTKPRTIYIPAMLTKKLDRIAKEKGWTRGRTMVSLLQGYLKEWVKGLEH